MGKYSDYNIIPIGDHCAISLILKELDVRKQSYPFDWVAKVEQLYDSNIIHNIEIISEVNASENIDDIVKKYIGDAFETNNNINSTSNILFPHEIGTYTDIFEKYKRRFTRLKEDLNKKNIYILLTRHYHIEQPIFEKILQQLLSYNDDSVILFISGTNHIYFDNVQYSNVIFLYVEYDISQFYHFDYTSFRPTVKKFLSDFLL
jgi:hypothetical protein